MTVTLQTLEIRVRQRADMEGSDFVSQEEVFGYINDSYKELYDLLVSKFEDYYLADPLEFTIASGSSSYTLPSDFYKIIGLDYKFGVEDYQTVFPFVFADRNRRRISDKLRGLYTTARYRILGNELRLVPADRAEGTYRIWYVPRASEKTLATDVIDGVNGWEEYIVVDAAIKCMQKEESDVSVLMAQKAALQKRIEDMAQNRDAGSSQRVTDVTMNEFDDPLFYG